MKTINAGIAKSMLGSICMAAMLMGTGSAKATFYYSLDKPNPAISPYSGPYGTVAVDLTSGTTATITFTSLTKAGNIYLFGDGGSVGVNVNGPFTLGSITGANAGIGFTPGPYSNGGAGNEDGFGSFNLTINSFDGYTHSSDLVSFGLTLTSGTWANAASVLTPNGSGYSVAAHIFVTSDPANGANGALATGFAVNGNPGSDTPPPVPDGGSTMALMGLGVLGIDYLRRRIARS